MFSSRERHNLLRYLSRENYVLVGTNLRDHILTVLRKRGSLSYKIHLVPVASIGQAIWLSPMPMAVLK
ncbi:hypothetical protein I7I50_07339 [Histoplasma capsulatum G186AR]|uniref:Uncharacterized protein n=1 Tax=Ajellomyces capsulatus TaxID=5037 RepID=A0A8H7Z1B3_AJECA|nr:hypothetical protein I7I52_09589 [Histoplasma capsulatum]QSS68056.1 hypothetical protein I7I50_07339 [Histoplasma capsulatum G186AR]